MRRPDNSLGVSHLEHSHIHISLHTHHSQLLTLVTCRLGLFWMIRRMSTWYPGVRRATRLLCTSRMLSLASCCPQFSSTTIILHLCVSSTYMCALVTLRFAGCAHTSAAVVAGFAQLSPALICPTSLCAVVSHPANIHENFCPPCYLTHALQGFRKLPAAHQEFCHPCFKRGQPQLLSQIQRGGMPSSASHSAEGPAAEIANLKQQTDKLSKALTYTLAELHRRGYDTLRFDWKELVFVDPSACPFLLVLVTTESACQSSTTAAAVCPNSLLRMPLCTLSELAAAGILQMQRYQRRRSPRRTGR